MPVAIGHRLYVPVTMKRKALLYLLLLPAALRAQIRNDWENPQLVSLHTLRPHAHFTPYPDALKALKATASSLVLSLDGTWQFHLAANPDSRPADFFKPTYNVSKWKTIQVPANWQTAGYAPYIFTDVEYPFPPNPPFVPKDNNPVGSYRRNFQLPAAWKGKQVLLHLGAVNSFFYAWVNGHYLGFSKDSKTPAEFDVTPFLKAGDNTIAVQVFRFSDGSYLEGQDMWKLTGIERSVFLTAREPLSIYDFFAKPQLENNYKDGRLDLDLSLNKLPAITDKAKRIRVQLLDKETALFTESLQIGADSNFHMTRRLPGIRTWNAEHPHLYRLQVTLQDQQGRDLESFVQQIGFRNVEIRHGQLLVNGVPVKIKGVNRHEHDMHTAKVINREGMLRDIRVMKEYNINAVRNSHYPNREEWYELCDQYGIYVVDEANIECDGMSLHPLQTLSDKPEWKDAYLDRTCRMIERDKNHCSIITWSLGNESAFGDNFIATYQWAKMRDKTRPVQYEPARNTPYTDIVCPMYKSIGYMQEYVREYRDRPMIQCEYAHMMGNSGGNLADDWALMYKYDQLQGGFIWDFSDQTFLQHDSLGRAIWAYGADMGTVGATSDTSFCADGMLAADRSPHPQAFEVKKVYQPIHISPVDMSADLVRIDNRYDFSDLGNVVIGWELKGDGKTIATGVLPDTKVLPHQSETIRVSLPAITPQPGVHYFLHLHARLKNAVELLAAGHILATEQWALPYFQPVSPASVTGQPLNVQKGKDGYLIANDRFTVKFTGGWLSQFSSNGSDYMQSPLQPSFWRAATDNDIGNSQQLRCAVWQHAGDHARLLSCDVTQRDEQHVEVVSRHYLPDVMAHYNTYYTILSNGDIRVTAQFLAGDTVMPELPRMGMRMELVPALNQVSWLGRGPFDNYQDRKYAADVDLYALPADSLFHPYPRAQESGYRSDVHWMALHDATGKGWMARTDSLFNTGVLHFDMSRLDFNRKENRHGGSMYNEPLIWWNIDYQQAGLGGDNSWGAKPHAPYTLVYKNYQYSFTLRPLHTGDRATEKAKERYE
ncbi:MAG TPA: glycoside hydrolase family 2 TIM barrel-domain containing protein [Chitinophaga sp.]|uniref:glycoside hydrolase family 2 TIM barrel-domain containing protein n=1 Tax=Chitinophaga sp. TaxID=1869181 RepID=UPI002C205BD9|nr:glycoside hydrolase family 2 TIM barrel-domain containing protein [Chitinophaga sp.]HVI48398.1 glycoside hydrolase family 2 TIM barrel-domain containing protein [Chitinophaga sp.]